MFSASASATVVDGGDGAGGGTFCDSVGDGSASST